MTPSDFSRCIPNPPCPQQRDCARYHSHTAIRAMNASPYRTHDHCPWFVQYVREKA